VQGPWTQHFVYHSNLSSLSTELRVREVSRFAQHAFDFYHGYVQLRLVNRHYDPPPRLSTVNNQSLINSSKKSPGGKAVTGVGDRNLLCEVMISLPKVRFLVKISLISFSRDLSVLAR